MKQKSPPMKRSIHKGTVVSWSTITILWTRTNFSPKLCGLDLPEPIMKPTLALTLLLLAVLAVTLPKQLHAQDAEPKVSIVRIDPAFDKLVPKDATLEKLAGGYAWSEGPGGDKKH